MRFERPDYLSQLIRLEGNNRVKIITGIRRCGKSYLLRELYIPSLMIRGICSDHIIYVSLDSLEHRDLLNPLKLNDWVRSKIIDDEPYYILIDEIQNVFRIVDPLFTDGKIVIAKAEEENPTISFTDVVNGFIQIPNADVFITGSNSKFLSTDIVTEFRDRGDEIHVLPLSFREIVDATHPVDLSAAFEEYLVYGGMPLVFFYTDSSDKEKYLKNLFTTTYIKDVVERNKLKRSQELDDLCSVMASLCGSLVNAGTIAGTFQSAYKAKISINTINSWLKYLEEAYILSRVKRIDVRGRKQIGALSKYYFPDPGLRNAKLDFLHSDRGHVMEMIIYNELIRRGYSVQVGKLDIFENDSAQKTVRKTLETDFAAEKGSTMYYIQSAFEVNTSEQEEREKRPLLAIADNFKKIIIVSNPIPVRHDADGITFLSILTFLLEENSLEL